MKPTLASNQKVKSEDKSLIFICLKENGCGLFFNLSTPPSSISRHYRLAYNYMTAVVCGEYGSTLDRHICQLSIIIK